MHFTIYKSQLQKAVKNLVNIAPKECRAIPILTNIKMSVSDEGLKLTTSNLEILKSITINDALNQKLKNGEAFVDIRILQNILLKTKNHDLIEIEKHESQDEVIIKINKAKFTIYSIDSSEFPNFSNYNFDTHFEIDAESLFKLLESGFNIIGEDEDRVSSCGLYLKSTTEDNNKKLVAVATCDAIMIKSTIYCDQDIKDFDIRICKKAVSSIIKTEFDKKVKISLSEDYIKLIDNNNEIIIKLFNKHKFLDYKFLKNHSSDVIKVSTEIETITFLKTLEKALLFAKDKEKTTHLTFKKDSMTIGSKQDQNDNFYNFHEDLDIQCNIKEMLLCRVTDKNLINSIKLIKTNTLLLNLKDLGNDFCIIELMEINPINQINKIVILKAKNYSVFR
jgi:DNA polymerase III sliding clamp (beta) subunit (PCNA family)